MMKRTNVVPLMLLLIFAVNPRYISANPIASPQGGSVGVAQPSNVGTTGGSTAHSASDVAKDMEKDIGRLSETMNMLKDKTLDSQFDHAINELEKVISKVPFESPANQVEILENLYMSQNRLFLIRTTLNETAYLLKVHCRGLIGTYDQNTDTNLIVPLIKHSKERFLAFAKLVKRDLETAQKVTEEIADKLAKARSFLFVFHAQLNKKVNELEQKAAVDIQTSETGVQNTQQQIERLPNERVTQHGIAIRSTCPPGNTCVITILINVGEIYRSNDAIEELTGNNVSQENRQNIINELNIELEDLKPAEIAAKTLLTNVNVVDKYLTGEITLIHQWKQRLEVSIADQTVTPPASLNVIPGIKQRLEILINACDNYMKNVIPDLIISKYR